MAHPAPAPGLRQLTVPASFLLVVAAGAWVVVVGLARGMSAMPGTMGLSLGAFVVAWAVMMAAMMLPTVTPFAGLYTRTFVDHRSRRTAELAAGYLLVWTLAALPAYALAWLAGELAAGHPAAARVMAVAVFAVCGGYQLTRLKERCLVNCRSPLGMVFRYGSVQGRFRDLRIGTAHGAYCLGCCWALMVVLLAVGLMNLVAMVGLTAVVLLEKTWSRGRTLARAVGVAALVLAVVVAFRPSLAAGIYQAPAGGGMPMSGMR
jgi:predicted metal-binding membrane protein